MTTKTEAPAGRPAIWHDMLTGTTRNGVLTPRGALYVENPNGWSKSPFNTGEIAAFIDGVAPELVQIELL